MQELLIATGNHGKFREIFSVLAGVPYVLHSLSDLNLSADCDEKGVTFAEIAEYKARYFSTLVAYTTLAEDSGIFVDALPGELGIYTRRWGAPYTGSTDEEWIAYFLQRMKGVPYAQRKAKFVCAACIVRDGIATVFTAQTGGFITDDLQAPIQKGLPLSSCFIPDGYTKVYAALSLQEKATVSHRGKALSAVKTFLLQHL